MRIWSRNFLVSWLKCSICSLFPLSWIFIKTLLPYAHVQFNSLFLSEVSTVKCNLIIIVRKILGERKNFVLVEPNTGKINRYKHFLFFNTSNEYCCSPITQPMALFHVIFSHFNIYFAENINNLIFEIFAFNRLVDALHSYIVLSTILMSVFYFNVIIYQVTSNSWTWLSSLPTRFSNNEASVFKLWLISFL